MQAVFLGMLYTSVFKLTLLRSFGSYNGMLRTTPIKKKRCFCLISTQLPIFGWIQFSESVLQPSSGCCERKITGVLQKTKFYVHVFHSIAVIIHFPHCRSLAKVPLVRLSLLEGEGKVGSRVLYDPRGPGGNKAIASLQPTRLSLLTPNDKANKT